jgi:hypothetical protein
MTPFSSGTGSGGNTFRVPAGAVDADLGVGYHQGRMKLDRRNPRFRGNTPAGRRALLVFVAFLLVMAPLADLAWNEPALDAGQGTLCPLHANPGVAIERVSPTVARSSEPAPFSNPLRHFFLLSASIFIPPRALAFF